MDALKIISEGSIKLRSPSSTSAIPSALMFVSRKASASVSRLSRVPSLLRSTARRRDLYRSPRFLRVGIERVFPINSPFVEKVTVVRKGKVRRAKLFYLRGRTGKAAKVKSDI